MRRIAFRTGAWASSFIFAGLCATAPASFGQAEISGAAAPTGSPVPKNISVSQAKLDGADAKSKAEQTAQRFLGLRFRCAQCHDHPFDTWTQDDYFHLAAFFAKRKPNWAT